MLATDGRLFLNMPYRKRKGAARRGYAKRKPSKRRYVKKRKAYKRTQRKRRSAVSRKIAFPRALDIGSQHPAEITYKIPFMDSMTVWPSIVTSNSYPDAESFPNSWGGACKSIWANCPNWVYTPDPTVTPLTPVGRWMHDGFNTSDDNGVNPQVQTPSSFYQSMLVTKATIEVVFTPVNIIPDEYAGTHWNPEALVYINFNKDWNHFVGGTGITVDQMEYTPAIRQSKYTRVGNTQLSPGAKPQSCKLTGTYNPHLLWHFKDMGDDPNFDCGILLPSNATQPIVPTNPAHWEIGVMTPSPVPVELTAGGINMVRGVPLPHRVDIKVIYTVKFFNPRTAISYENIQIGPGGIM